ncbi:hypothetical protein NO559_10785 [Dasania sp. GY-MA-18]|uniref:Uncharacterized protein n=1 Tax=Dasania phycosphaerae TaxID=2950436 RepID=A0A9J6RLV2_9GAMM|nr:MULTISPECIES: hypothetical protein [Dasania]MCR8923262.1 hypothetical protein [Dasania sp. GY-MA-18]MCZ0865694.1 hypothetical protein [Dasania phycosphaerae]MCZ0869419.1 hypothetical protein [Dasania phycosphaerae]
MNSKSVIEEILDRAAHQHISAQELDMLVAKTREISLAKEQELATLKTLLQELEAHQHH